MLGIDPNIIIAVVTNVGAILGVYSQLIQRLTRLETEQKHVSDMAKILLERRLKDREQLRQTFQENNQ